MPPWQRRASQEVRHIGRQGASHPAEAVTARCGLSLAVGHACEAQWGSPRAAGHRAARRAALAAGLADPHASPCSVGCLCHTPTRWPCNPSGAPRLRPWIRRAGITASSSCGDEARVSGARRTLLSRGQASGGGPDAAGRGLWLSPEPGRAEGCVTVLDRAIRQLTVPSRIWGDTPCSSACETRMAEATRV